MKINKQYEYPKLERVTFDDGKRFYRTPEGDELNSVTTILSATKDSSGLDKWRDFVGNTKADEIVRNAVNIGTIMHFYLENWIAGTEVTPKTNHIHKMAHKLATKIWDYGLKDQLDEVWGIEEHLYYPKLYAGTGDLIGVYNGKPSIMDFKSSRKMKKLEYLQDYGCQLAAYAMAHNTLFDTEINQGVIFMSSYEDDDYQTFVFRDSTFEQFKDQWVVRLSSFLESL